MCRIRHARSKPTDSVEADLMNPFKAVARLLFFWKKPRAVVPVVRLSGVIASSSQMRRGLSLEGVEPQLKKAFAMRGAKAVALIINSPGGSPVQSALIGKRVRDLARKGNVPVLAFCEDVAASGGYWLAASADEIYANAASVVGSIGVVSAGFGFDRAIERLGVERRVYTAGTNKMILDPFQPEKEADVLRLKSLQSEIHEQFITHVTDRRGGKLTGAHEDLFSGAFWTGAAAVKLGLIDGLADCRGMVTERFGEDTDLVTIEPKKRLFGGFGGLPGTLVGRVVDDAVDVAVERAHMARFGL
jgi:signal peptide peptidase SppA